MKKFSRLTISFILTMFVVMISWSSSPALTLPAPTAPDLGTAANFVVLAGSKVTNTGPGVFVGDVGVSPGTDVIGFPPGIIRQGTIYKGGAVPLQAQIDANTAYNDLAGQTCNVNLTDQDLGGMTLPPGVYCFNSSAQLTGNLVLNAQGDPLAVWVFQIGTTLTAASASSVVEINDGQAINVFWQVGSSATIGTGSQFTGNILADASITINAEAGLIGRAIALNGAVTMDTNGPPNSPPISNTPLFRFNYLPLIMRQ